MPFDRVPSFRGRPAPLRAPPHPALGFTLSLIFRLSCRVRALRFSIQAQRADHPERRRQLSTAKKKSEWPAASTLLNGEEEGAMSYRQLTLDERYHIEVHLKEGLSQADIARRLGRAPSTIAREL